MHELAAPLDASLPLRDLAVSNLHQQHSLIATSKISTEISLYQDWKANYILPSQKTISNHSNANPTVNDYSIVIDTILLT